MGSISNQGTDTKVELTNEQKIDVARDFVSHHKITDVTEWQPYFDDSDSQYLRIFSKLENGEYGNITDDAEYDEDGNIITKASEWRIEIGSFESKDGNPYVFEWYIDS